jgi:phosphoribosylformylglycinamidine cyclo-ligase
MQQPEGAVPATYAEAGVDEEREQSVFAKVMRPWLARTSVRSPLVTRVTGLSSGYFATMMHLPPGPPLAITTDGVGTKILLARQAGRYEGIGVDVIANNVNDLVCVGADPLVLLDYLATDRIDEPVLEALARGMYKGAEQAGIAIPGGEIAQIGAMLAPADETGPMLDLVGTALGAMPADPSTASGYREPVDGSGVRPGDVVIGLPSSGLHSNGYSLARHVLLDKAGMSLDERVLGGDATLADVLLEPTRVYVNGAAALWNAGVTPRGLAHISGGGLLNLARLAADVSYVLDTLPEPGGVFALIEQTGLLSAASRYATFNMGIGFCVVVAPEQRDAALAALAGAGEQPVVIGYAEDRPGRYVTIPAAGLIGQGDAFETLA